MALVNAVRNWMEDLTEAFRMSGHTAAWADDDHNSLVVNSDIADAVEVLDAERWTVREERSDVAGTVHASKVVIMGGGPFDLKLIQVGSSRTLIVAEEGVVTELKMTQDRTFASPEDEDEFPIGTPRMPGMGIERYGAPTLMSMGSAKSVLARLRATKRGK